MGFPTDVVKGPNHPQSRRIRRLTRAPLDCWSRVRPRDKVLDPVRPDRTRQLSRSSSSAVRAPGSRQSSIEHSITDRHLRSGPADGNPPVGGRRKLSVAEDGRRSLRPPRSARPPTTSCSRATSYQPSRVESSRTHCWSASLGIHREHGRERASDQDIWECPGTVGNAKYGATCSAGRRDEPGGPTADRSR